MHRTSAGQLDTVRIWKALTMVYNIFVKGPTQYVYLLPQPKTETHPIPESLCFPVIYNSWRWTKSRSPLIACTGYWLTTQVFFWDLKFSQPWLWRIILDITQCSPLKASPRFGLTCRLHRQCWRVCQTRTNMARRQLLSRFLFGLFIRP
jgi:hypothetical protein